MSEQETQTEQVQAPVQERAPAAPAHAPSGPMGGVMRSASAIGNQSFSGWAQGPGASGAPLPGTSARSLWGGPGPVVARDPEGGGAAAPAADADADKKDKVELPSGLKFGKAVIDGTIDDLDAEYKKTFSTSFGDSKAWGPWNLDVPLAPGIMARFGAAATGSISVPDASLTLQASQHKNSIDQSTKQLVAASGQGSAKGAMAGSLVAGLAVGVPGTNVGIFGQGTMALGGAAVGNFKGALSRFKPKGEDKYLPWHGELSFDVRIDAVVRAAANGYFQYEVLWLFKDQFGHFKIGEWDLAEGHLIAHVSAKPGEGTKVDIKPSFGKLNQPGTIMKELRARTDAEAAKAAALARKSPVQAALGRSIAARAGDEPPPAAPPPADGQGGAPPPNAAAGPAPDPSAAAAAPAAPTGPAPATGPKPAEVAQMTGVMAPDEGDAATLPAGPEPTDTPEPGA